MLVGAIAHVRLFCGKCDNRVQARDLKEFAESHIEEPHCGVPLID